MGKLKYVLAIGLIAAIFQPAWAALNNGFETDYIYALRETGNVLTYKESDGTGGATVIPSGSGWQSLTFAGKGNNDARLFVAKSTGTDIQINEYDAAGNVVQSKLLSSLGVSLGSSVVLGNIRYNKTHNTLIVGANTDANQQNIPAKAFEINLSLNQLVHTYVGANLPNTTSGEARPVNVDFDEATGSLLMISRHLGRSTTDNKGNLIAFNTVGRTVGGTTSSFTTLIDGGVYSAGNSTYTVPHTVMWRSTNNPSGRPTILIPTQYDANWRPVLEFYLDQVDSNGNLVLRGTADQAKRGWNGQLDEVTGQVWYGAVRGGIKGVWADDTTTYYQSSSNWLDADSPAPEPVTLALLGLGFLMLRRRGA